MDIKIRDAVIDDYERLCEIYDELDKEHRLNHPELYIKPDGNARSKDYILQIIKDNNRALFVSEINSKVVGFAECYIQKTTNFPVLKKREWVQIDSFVVSEEYQNYHVGTYLLEKVIEWSKTKEIQRVELKVFTFNKKAIDFYLKKGFKDLNITMYLDMDGI